MRTLSRDTSPQAEKVQVDLLRRAGPARRFALALSLSRTTIDLARMALKRRMPEATDQEILLAFLRLHYGADLAERVAKRLEETLS